MDTGGPHPWIGRAGVAVVLAIVLAPIRAVLERSDWTLALAVAVAGLALALVYRGPRLLRRR